MATSMHVFSFDTRVLSVFTELFIRIEGPVNHGERKPPSWLKSEKIISVGNDTSQ